jgi:PAS domain S-box-containing protein
MQDQDKTKEELINELQLLRQRVSVLEAEMAKQRQAQESLERSERHYRTLIDTLPLVVYEYGVDGLITLASAAIQTVAGYSPEELVGTYVWERMGPAARQEEAKAYLRRIAAEQPPPTPFFGRSRNKAGEDVDIRVDWNYLRDERGQVAGFVSVSSDVTALNRAREALQESERRLSTLIANLPGMVYRCKIDFRWTMEYVSEGCAALLGCDASKMIGKDAIHLGDMIHPDDRKMVWEEVQKGIAQRQRFQLTYRVRTVQGEEKWVWEQGVAICSESGDPEALEGFITDISERKWAEDALRMAHHELERRVEQRTGELKDANERLQRERRTLEHLLRASDHERQLIAYDIHDGLAQQLVGALMQFQVYEHSKDTNSNDATKAFEAGMTMLRQSHFEARRLISGVRPPILDEAGITAAIAHLVHDQGNQGPQIEFQSRVTFHRLTPILENAIYRIAQEALTNACKHSRSEKVRVSLAQDKDLVSLEVRDWGIGFDVTAIRDDRFGLAGIRERVRLLGGELSLESQPGEGASIQVTLSIVE